MMPLRKWIGLAALAIGAVMALSATLSYAGLRQQQQRLQAVRAQWLQLRQS